jgi:hypothetical protein
MSISARRVRDILLAGVILVGLLPAGTASAASTLLVDDDLTECPDAAFTSIQAAAQAAAPGDRIDVCPGTYTEEVEVATSRLTFTGRPGAVLDGSGTAGRAGFLLETESLSHITIAGFTIRNYASDPDPGQGNGIRSYGVSTSHVTIRGNVVEAVRWNGVYAAGDAEDPAEHRNWRVEGNTIRDVGADFGLGGNGVELTGCTGCRVSGNTIERAATRGVLLAATGDDEAKGGQVRDNTVAATHTGIEVLAYTFGDGAPTLRQAKVQRNTVTATTYAGVLIRAYGAGALVRGVGVDGNDIVCAGGAGVVVAEQAGGEVEQVRLGKGNTFAACAPDVVDVADA